MQATPPLGAALAAATRTHGEATTVLPAAAVMGLPALFLAPDLLATDPSRRQTPNIPALPKQGGEPFPYLSNTRELASENRNQQQNQ